MQSSLSISACGVRRTRFFGQRTIALKFGDFLDPPAKFIRHSRNPAIRPQHFVRERLVETGPLARNRGLSSYHPGFRVDFKRRIQFPPKEFRQEGALPEGKLWEFRHSWVGVMGPLVVGAREPGSLNYGSSVFISPVVRDPVSGELVVMVATAYHTVELTEDMHIANLIRVPDFDEVYDKGVVCCAFSPIDTQNDLHQIYKKVPFQAPQAQGVTPAFGRLYSAAGKMPVIPDAPDIAFLKVRAIPDDDSEPGQVWPWTAAALWGSNKKQDWVVPHATSSVGRFVAMCGTSGRLDESRIEGMYGVPLERAKDFADFVTQEIMPSDVLVVASGDAVTDGGGYIAHRVSANSGMSGAGLRPIDQPQLLYGIHLGGGNTVDVSYNIATSVNHPLFVSLYAEQVLPLLVGVQKWPAPYMASALAQYLRHHQDLLQKHGLWEAHAKGFVKAFG